ncbi:hypothetical protein HDU86_007122 [Geranomyces michiganensis]|nr:hypothetical protein HDU86_007122 [Geranomyces michiganensis]
MLPAATAAAAVAARTCCRRAYATVPSPVFASRSFTTRKHGRRVLAAVTVIGMTSFGGYRLYTSFKASQQHQQHSDEDNTPLVKPANHPPSAGTTPAMGSGSTQQQPRPIVLCGPSGSGKSTLLKRLLAEHPTKFGFSVSHTTRAPRAGETDGKEYHFVTPAQFAALVDKRAFVEHASFAGNSYGTSLTAVSDVLKSGRNVILDIDVQGVRQLQEAIKKGHAQMQGGSPLFLFVAPPSMKDLEQRLRGRGTENDETLKKRLEAANGEMEWGTGEGHVDRVIVNSDVEAAYRELNDAIFGTRT